MLECCEVIKMKKTILFVIMFALASASALAVVQSHPATQIYWNGYPGYYNSTYSNAYVFPIPMLFAQSVYFGGTNIYVYGKPDSSDSHATDPNLYGYQQGQTVTFFYLDKKLQFTQGVLTKVDSASAYLTNPCKSVSCAAKCECPQSENQNCLMYPSGVCVPLKYSIPKTGYVPQEGVDYYCNRVPLIAACRYGCSGTQCAPKPTCATYDCINQPNDCQSPKKQFKRLLDINLRGVCQFEWSCCTDSCSESPPAGCYTGALGQGGYSTT